MCAQKYGSEMISAKPPPPPGYPSPSAWWTFWCSIGTSCAGIHNPLSIKQRSECEMFMSYASIIIYKLFSTFDVAIKDCVIQEIKSL